MFLSIFVPILQCKEFLAYQAVIGIASMLVMCQLTVTTQAAQAYYVWIRASEVIWLAHTSMISVLSDAE